MRKVARHHIAGVLMTHQDKYANSKAQKGVVGASKCSFRDQTTKTPEPKTSGREFRKCASIRSEWRCAPIKLEFQVFG